MTDPLILCIVSIVSLGVGIQQTVYHCADADLHANRLWWRKALFRARQRVEYKEFCRDAESKIKLENDSLSRRGE